MKTGSLNRFRDMLIGNSMISVLSTAKYGKLLLANDNKIK